MNRTQLLNFDSPPVSGTGHGVHHANVGGFVKASSLLLKTVRKSLKKFKAYKKAHIPKLLGCQTWHQRYVSIRAAQKLESHVQEKIFHKQASQNTNN